MTDILIVYATREGQTEKVARRLADCLKSGGAGVQLVDVARPEFPHNRSLESFDLLVFGASMHAGGLESEIVDFINANAARIGMMSRSFFLVLLSAAAKDSQLRSRWLADARNKMNRQLSVEFDEVEMIAGALAYSKYSLPLKWLMQRIARKAGEDTDTSRDYEYTDWAQVDRYARILLAGRRGNPDLIGRRKRSTP